MKKTKRLWILVLAIMMLMMVSANVFAASVYVPTEGNKYKWDADKKKWVKYESFKTTFDKSGRIKKYVRKSKGKSFTETFKWKENLVVEDKYTDNTGNGIYSRTIKRKNKKNLLTKMVLTETSDGNTTKSTYTYSWKGKKATGKKTSKTESTKYTVVIDGKKRPVKYIYDTFTSTHAYYKNGNIKKSLIGGAPTFIDEYNSAGYSTSWTNKIPCHENGNRVGTVTYKETYTYTMDKKRKCPKSMIKVCTRDGVFTEKYKTIYTSFKKVSRTRNCDAFAYDLPGLQG